MCPLHAKLAFRAITLKMPEQKGGNECKRIMRVVVLQGQILWREGWRESNDLVNDKAGNGSRGMRDRFIKF
jgi:hypothetical protein